MLNLFQLEDKNIAGKIIYRFVQQKIQSYTVTVFQTKEIINPHTNKE